MKARQYARLGTLTDPKAFARARAEEREAAGKRRATLLERALGSDNDVVGLWD